MRARGSYQASVVPHIDQEPVHVSPHTQALVDDATQALTRFDTEAGYIAAPFAALLLRSESASSSEVENLTASAKQIALAEIGASRANNARLIVANVHAMNAAIELSDDISEATIVTMHRALLEESAPHYTGTFRQEQVWIGGGSISPHQAEFVPPHHEYIPALMADLVRFAQRTDVPVLMQAAIAHAQFETIHPFPDGNGRVGRALIHSMLRHGRLTQNVTVPVSAGLLTSTQLYFDALTDYRSGNIDPIVTVLAEAAFTAVAGGRALVTELRAIAEEWRGVKARAGSAAESLKDLLMRQPVITTALVAEQLQVSEVAAQNAINLLAEHEVLVQTNASKRNRVWHSPQVLAALDSYAAKARRRH